MREVMYVLIVALLTLSLAGCVTNGRAGVSVKLPKAQSYYTACFHKLTPIPVGDLSRDKVVRLVAALRKSELAKSQCGKDLLHWYDAVAKAYAK